jgi:GT2 family glycosyltransferase
MLFSIVIPTCDRPDLLGLCLDALAPGAQTFGEAFETIVTDDGTVSVEALIRERYPWARWVEGPRSGPAANRNHGAAQATGDWLVFTDDDCLPRADWLDHYGRAIRANPEARAFEGSIHPRGDLNRDLAECPVNLTGECFWSANICVSRTLFGELDGFDERFQIAAHEDQDLFLRLKPRTAVPFVKDAAVFHPVRYRTLWQSLRDLDKRSLNWLMFAKAHSDELDYHSDLGIIAAASMSQFRAAYQALKSGYPRQVIRALVTLVYGVPLVAWRLAVTRASGPKQ